MRQDGPRAALPVYSRRPEQTLRVLLLALLFARKLKRH